MAELSFSLRGEFIELCKLLKATGVCESGGSAKYAVSQDMVKVDGQIETRKGCKIHRGSRIEYNGHTILVQ